MYNIEDFFAVTISLLGCGVAVVALFFSCAALRRLARVTRVLRHNQERYDELKMRERLLAEGRGAEWAPRFGGGG
jgi:hypothetical protein